MLIFVAIFTVLFLISTWFTLWGAIDYDDQTVGKWGMAATGSSALAATAAFFGFGIIGLVFVAFVLGAVLIHAGLLLRDKYARQREYDRIRWQQEGARQMVQYTFDAAAQAKRNVR